MTMTEVVSVLRECADRLVNVPSAVSETTLDEIRDCVQRLCFYRPAVMVQFKLWATEGGKECSVEWSVFDGDKHWEGRTLTECMNKCMEAYRDKPTVRESLLPLQQIPF